MKSQLRISDSSILVKIESEPYVIYTKRGYQPAVDVIDLHSGTEGFMIISAMSLADGIQPMVLANKNKFSGIIAVISRASREKTAPYIVRSEDD
jgi:hypothetical protein